jgi:U32 family peptidase
MKNSVELLAPISDFASLHAAIEAGADAIYFGLSKFSMRARPSNSFTLEDISKVTSICKKNNVKSYVTLNTVVYNDEINTAHQICDFLKKSDIDAIIASDFAVLTYARSINLPIHLSTQANVSNIESVKFFSQFADVIVLARELTLEQIKDICEKIKKENIQGPSKKNIKIELFAHGALCVAISGKCYMSLAQYNFSANKGSCLHPCRRKYKIIEEDTNQELIIDNHYVMSPKDLCTLPILDKIIDAGVSILKIEGRGKAPEYVYTVIKSYKDALDSIANNTFSNEKITSLLEDLQTVYNRGFWEGGYYLGEKLGKWSNSSGSQSTFKKTYIGKVTNYFSKINVAEVKLEAHLLKENDHIIVIGQTTGVIKHQVKLMKDINKKTIKQANKGETITFESQKKLRKNDQIYLFEKK